MILKHTTEFLIDSNFREDSILSLATLKMCWIIAFEQIVIKYNKSDINIFIKSYFSWIRKIITNE